MIFGKVYFAAKSLVAADIPLARQLVAGRYDLAEKRLKDKGTKDVECLAAYLIGSKDPTWKVAKDFLESQVPDLKNLDPNNLDGEHEKIMEGFFGSR